MSTHDAFIAVHRFGLGAAPGDLEDGSPVRRDPRGWLRAQLEDDTPLPRPLVGLDGAATRVATFRAAKDKEDRKEIMKGFREAYADEALRRTLAAAASPQPFRERLVRLYADVLTVSITQNKCLGLVGPFEREVIRPHLTGTFPGMLQASCQHPAMLFYLDNVRSTGPNSTAGQRRDSLGRNENLAREVLELHTMGVSGGYTQQDVIALADMLTGWTVANDADQAAASASGFAFARRRHEPGAQTMLGQTYPNTGQQQAEAALNDLARHPATAKRLAWRMARHFVADDPSPDVTAPIAQALVETGGDLKAAAAAMIDCDAAWAAPMTKIRRPEELVIASMRGLWRPEQLDALDEKQSRKLVKALKGMGQMPWSAPSPEGWPDTADDWLDGDALLRRIRWAEGLGQRAARRQVSPQRLAQTIFGADLPEQMAVMVRGAPDRATGLALVLASPLFQRR